RSSVLVAMTTKTDEESIPLGCLGAARRIAPARGPVPGLTRLVRGVPEDPRTAAEARQRVRRQYHRGRGPARSLPRERCLVSKLPAGPVGAVLVAQVLHAR